MGDKQILWKTAKDKLQKFFTKFFLKAENAASAPFEKTLGRVCWCVIQNFCCCPQKNTAMWSVCAQSSYCVASCFHPWKSPSFIHDPRCSHLHSVWWEAHSSNSGPTLKTAWMFFHRNALSVMYVQYGVNICITGSYMYTLALVLLFCLSHIKRQRKLSAACYFYKATKLGSDIWIGECPRRAF